MSIKLYILKHAVATEDTGPYNPQIANVIPELDYTSEKSVYRLFDNFFEFPVTDPTIEFASLRKGAKLSDLLSSSIFVLLGFLVSLKFRKILEGFSLPEHKFYRVPVNDGRNLYDYFWLHMLLKYQGNSFNEIQNLNTNFNDSKFHISKHLQTLEHIEVTSSEELFAKQKELTLGKSIKADYLTLNSNFLDQTPDIFKIPILSNHWIIKQQVYNTLLSEKIKGVDLTEVVNIKFH